MSKNIVLIVLIFQFLFVACSKTIQKKSITKSHLTTKAQDSIIKQAKTCTSLYNYNIHMADWQACLDKGLAKDSTIAYLWQQKAMPYFKAKKYEVGMQYIDKAVTYDAEQYLPYRAFIKCIFAKTYKDAITDFETCIKYFGNGYVMDHTFKFYIGLSYLQLNKFEKADHLFDSYIETLLKENGQAWVHPTALFYSGIANYELKKYDVAITQFDRALKLYPHFSDAEFYKAISLINLGKQEAAQKVFNAYVEDSKAGYTINEDNVIYETYPYQKRKIK